MPNENLYLVSWGINSRHKKWSRPFVACPPNDDLKISLQPTCSSKSHKYDKHDKITCSFPLLLVPPGKPVHQAIHYLMTNFGPLFDHYLTQDHQEFGKKVGFWTKILLIWLFLKSATGNEERGMRLTIYHKILDNEQFGAGFIEDNSFLWFLTPVIF